MLSKFGGAIGVSAVLHLGAVGVLTMRLPALRDGSAAAKSERIASGERKAKNAASELTEYLTVDVATEAGIESRHFEARQTPAVSESPQPSFQSPSVRIQVHSTAATKSARPEAVRQVESERAHFNDSMRSPIPRPASGSPHPDASAAVESIPASVASSDVTVDKHLLHQAIQAAAAMSGAAPATPLPPIFRVDPQEKNLDRALARAYAWAFAVDRSYFATPPVGRARFVIELTDDGRIGGVTWSELPQVPSRLKSFVQRIAKLLAANRFRALDRDGRPSTRRAYELTIVESHVALPKQSASVDGQVGDIWMLESGDTPTVEKAGRPAVADATGHQLRGELRILLPNDE